MSAALDLSDVPAELRDAVTAALEAAGASDGHLSVELADAEAIRALNREHRGRDEPTDVLAFPLDGADQVAGPRELGDVVICPVHAADLDETAVHGVLHLCGYDHETDRGEMLALQASIMRDISSQGASATGDPGEARIRPGMSRSQKDRS